MPTRHPLTKKQSCMSQKKADIYLTKKPAKPVVLIIPDLQDSYNFLEIRA